MNIYLGNETNFNNNGLGFLTDTINSIVSDELNGNYELKLEYVMNGHLSEYLVEENIIKCPVADGTKQLFRITNVSKTFKTISIIAKHIYYDLNNNFLADVYPQNKNGQTFGQYILDNTDFANPFTFVSDITNLKSARYVRVNPTQAIMGDIENSMIKLFGGELKRDNFTINFLSRVGQDNGVKLLIGKNITGINISVDITEMATRVMPQGYDNLLLPELYVDSPLINNYPTPKVIKLEFNQVKYDPNDENAYHTLDEAYAELRRLVNEQYSLGLDKPKINIDVNWVELSKTEEYKQYSSLETVRLGDTITAQILGIDYTTRVIATSYNVLKDRIVNFQIGTFKQSLATSMNSLKQSVEEISPSSILEQAKTEATSLITSAMGGYIYKTQSELYIMDNPDPQLAQKVWRWNINGLGYSSTGINGTYGIAMTMDGSIVADFITTGTLNTSVIQGYGSLTTQVQDNTDAIGDRTGRTSTITQDIASIEAQIGDIADITTSASSDTAIITDDDLRNIASSFPIRIEVYPINDNISYIYPSNNLFPSSTLFSKIRDIKFTNTTTNETFTYTLPTDLLYYDADNFDSYIADYDTDLITITKKCKYNNDGTIGLLETPVVTTMPFADSGLDFTLTEGNYQVELPGYSSGYIFARLMVLNAYTAQYATKVELRSAISQSATNIMTEVSADFETKEDATSTANSLSTRISQTVRSISLTANDNGTSCGLTIKLKNEDGTELSTNQANITLSGLVKFTDLSGSGTTTINGANITTGTISAARLDSSVITTSNFSAQNINANRINAGSINASNGITIGGFTIGNYSLYGSTNRGTMNIQRGSNASIDFPANGGRLMLGSTAGNGVALTTANRLVISDQYGDTVPHGSLAQIEIYTANGDLRFQAANHDISMNARGLYIDGHQGQSIDRIIYKDSNNNNKYLIFYKGILIGYN